MKLMVGYPPHVVAELSENNNGLLQRALDTILAAKNCGADAIKLQTYTADTITISSKRLFENVGFIKIDSTHSFDI
jgi:sialic acid synthase SpsE